VLCESTTGYHLKHKWYKLGNQLSLETVHCLSPLKSFCRCWMTAVIKVISFSLTTIIRHQISSWLLRKTLASVHAVQLDLIVVIYPVLLPSQLNLAKGDDPVFARSDNLVACAWHNTKRVHFLSNVHTNLTNYWQTDPQSDLADRLQKYWETSYGRYIQLRHVRSGHSWSEVTLLHVSAQEPEVVSHLVPPSYWSWTGG